MESYMESYYDVNVSLNGSHFFATHPRSINYIGTLRKVLPEIIKRFPEAEGFKVTVTRWQGTGEGINIEEILKSN